MKMSFKIFTISFLLVTILLSIFGFIIIETTFENEIKMESNSVKSENYFLSKVVNSIYSNNIYYYTPDIPETSVGEYFISIFKNISNNGNVFIGEYKDLKYIDEEYKIEYLNKMNAGDQISRVVKENNDYYYQVISCIKTDDESIFIEHITSLKMIYETRQKNYDFYKIILIIGSVISSSVLGIFSLYITHPLKKLSDNSRRIASGDYSVRNDYSLKNMKSIELSNLAKEMNDMTEKIESHIIELQDYNQRQDDFISRFTHELKTPLTSIIGYADVLRTYDMEPKKRHEMANYIYKEGKRLEELSFHLLKLILLKNDDFELIEYNSKKLFRELERSTVFLTNKYEVEVKYEIDDAILYIEPILIKSLLYNLVDNACKATVDDKTILIKGKNKGNKYKICVVDHGKGIDKENLSKVTDPFFMEDKSRARSLGGAGLGLSLCKEIAAIHESELDIKSKVGSGTSISFKVGLKNE